MLLLVFTKLEVSVNLKRSFLHIILHYIPVLECQYLTIHFDIHQLRSGYGSNNLGDLAGEYRIDLNLTFEMRFCSG